MKTAVPIRVPGTAVFMYGTSDGTPPALIHNLAHNKVLHEKIVFLTVVTHDVPHVAPPERVTVKRIGKGLHSVIASYGFMDDPDIGDVLAACRVKALDIRIEGTTFFLGRETLVTSERHGMAQWRENLFAFMSRNALRATAFFKIPANRSEEHTSEFQSQSNLVCRLLLEKKKKCLIRVVLGWNVTLICHACQSATL